VAGGKASGRFWLAEADDEPLAGHLDIQGRWPRVEVAGEFTPFLERIKIDENGTSHFGPAPMGNEDLTVQGRLGGILGAVTVIGASTRHRSNNIFGGLAEHVVEGRYALVGAHVDSADHLFDAARLRLYGLHDWARLPGLSVSLSSDRNSVDIDYEAPEPMESPLDGLGGVITVEPAWTLPQANVSGVSIETHAWLTWKISEGRTLDDLMRDLVVPTATLLTLLFNEDCPVLALQVHDNVSDRWLDVYSPVVQDPPESRPKAPVLSLTQFGLSSLATWLDGFATLSPLPQLVAGATNPTGRSVQNQLLELAAAAEGLHRRLHPKARQLSPEQVEADLQALAAASISPATGELLKNALATYLWEPSYPQRLRHLVAETAEAAPGVAGKQNKWRNRVANARIGFAHSLPGGSEDEDVFAWFTIARSLRWLLTTRLLMEVGLPAEALSQALTSSNDYSNFLTAARRDLPDVYGN
jgi:hypothetical protein